MCLVALLLGRSRNLAMLPAAVLQPTSIGFSPTLSPRLISRVLASIPSSAPSFLPWCSLAGALGLVGARGFRLAVPRVGSLPTVLPATLLLGGMDYALKTPG